MTTRKVAATQFKAECLRLIDEIGASGESLTITRHGKPVAMLSPIPEAAPAGLIGARRGRVMRYVDPFGPATQAEDWAATA
ncbi:prevent-host-death protein [Ancylobacter sp. WKF20]|uniref:type II toxin-antitoxin system Phd/YefM family antitoxin n=1 Tax=Ancylobacter sp. WKF20 TaxID=3039801 RepID=UPI00243419B2|nr:prevent-host-death protein [Ancylobacter sp. WKF20]WGD30449.1 prevent-host-death protein [Ancylobacter sp. WKF20]